MKKTSVSPANTFFLLTRVGVSSLALFCLMSCSGMGGAMKSVGLGQSEEEEMAASLGPKRLPALNAGDKTAGAVMMEKGRMPASQSVPNLGMDQMGTVEMPGQSPVLYQAPEGVRSQNAAPQQNVQRAAQEEEKPGLWGKTKNLFGMGDEKKHSSASQAQEYPLLNQTPENPAIVPVEVRHQAMDELQFQQQQNETLRQDFMKNGENTFIGQTPAVGTTTSALSYAMPADENFVPKVAPIQPAPAAVASAPMVAPIAAPAATDYTPPTARVMNAPAAMVSEPVLPAPVAPAEQSYTPMVNGKPSVLPPPPASNMPRPVDLVVPPALSNVGAAPIYAPQAPVKDLSQPAAPMANKEYQGDVSMGAPIAVPPVAPVATSSGLPSPSSFDDESPRASRLLAPSRYSDRAQ